MIYTIRRFYRSIFSEQLQLMLAIILYTTGGNDVVDGPLGEIVRFGERQNSDWCLV